MAEAENIMVWQRQRLAEAEVKKPHFFSSLKEKGKYGVKSYHVNSPSKITKLILDISELYQNYILSQIFVFISSKKCVLRKDIKHHQFQCRN